MPELNEFEKELISFCSELRPIVESDPEVKKFIKQQKLTKDSIGEFIFWVTLMIAWNVLQTKQDQKLKQMCEIASNLSVSFMKKLQQKYKNLPKTSWDFFAKRLNYWIEQAQNKANDHIKQMANEPVGKLKRKSKPAADSKPAGRLKRKSKPTQSNKKVSDQAITLYGIFLKFLQPIIEREDDVTEFIEKYSDADPTYVKLTVAAPVIVKYVRSHLDKDISDGLTISDELGNDLLSLASFSADDAISRFSDKVDVKQFNEDLDELQVDHQYEFTKKLYKAIVKYVKNM